MEFMNVEEVAAILGLSTKSVRGLIASGDMQAYKIGRQWRITKEALDEFLKTKSNIQSEEN